MNVRYNNEPCPAEGCGSTLARALGDGMFRCLAVGCGNEYRRSRKYAAGMRRSALRPKRRTPEEREVRYVENYGALADVVRRMRCIVKGCQRREVEVCHVKTKRNNGPWVDSGRGLVGNLVPMCMEHHRMQHTRGVKTFESEHEFVVETLLVRTEHATLADAAAQVGRYARTRGVDPLTNRWR